MKISFKNISFAYGSGPDVLHNLSLVMEKGEQVALVGANGTGKTTLIKHLNGLLRPRLGKVSIGSWVTSDKRTAELAKRVALTFQNPDDQICCTSVKKELEFGPVRLGYSPEEVNGLVSEGLKRFCLSGSEEKHPYDLGYSKRKLLSIAAAVVMDTPVVVFDEPTAGLDGLETEIFLNVLGDLKHQGRTVIIISHDMDLVAETIPRIVCLQDGAIRYDGTTREFLSDDLLVTSCGLIAPQIVRLSRACSLPDTSLTPGSFVDQLIKMSS